MRVSTRVHGIIDDLIGAALVASPWLLAYGIAGPAGWVAVAGGLAIILNTLTTDFEMGRFRSIPIPVHLWIDAVLGLFLAVSPWLLSFDQTAWAPHLAAGILIILVAFLTATVPGYDRRSDAAAAG